MAREHAATLLTVVIFVAWFLALGPAPIGGPATYVVIDGTSMEPALSDGDLAIVRTSSAYRPGDIVAFRLPGSPSRALVVHRIIGGSAQEGYLTQGDNRTDADPWRPRPEDIAGSLWLTVPGAGRSVAVLRNPRTIAPLAAGVTVFLVLLGGGARGRHEPPPRPDETARHRRINLRWRGKR